MDASGLRCEVDLGTDRMNCKIRQGQLQKIPYMIIVGDKEVDSDTVSVRSRNGEEVGVISLKDLVSRIVSESDNKE